jgi:hypothetical protein
MAPIHFLLRTSNSVATPILGDWPDGSKRVIAVLAGRPAGETERSWKGVHDRAFHAMGEAEKSASFTKEQSSHRRGRYRVLATGSSFGGGQRASLHLELAGHGSN